MKISEIGEFGLIDRIGAFFCRDGAGLIRGIGDDAAVLDAGGGRCLLATADMLLEGIHFDRRTITPHQLGMKMVAVNVSDIAAMGGAPRWMILSIGLPAETAAAFVDDFSKGASEMAARHGIVLIGGDTVASADGIVLNLTLLGEVAVNELVQRKGAGDGDQVFVTGTIGDSAAGLKLLSAGEKKTGAPFDYLVARHLCPTPRIKEGRYLAAHKLATAMIDLSDGLVQDLEHVCRESGVGAKIWFDRVPFSTELLKYCESGAFDVETALTGGEDYELLFTVPIEKIESLDMLEKELGCRLTHVGEICKGSGVTVYDSANQPVALKREGYEHFRASA